MRVGLLWFDPDPRRSPIHKADAAAARFAERVGRPADACRVHPGQLFQHPTLRVIADPSVPPHHLLVGCEEAEAPLVGPQAVSQPRPAAAPNRARRSC